MNAKTLVDEIKLCLKNGAGNTDVLRLGNDYVQAYKDASRRLQRCVDLIRQGKESTALQEAQFSPPLMGVLEALTFPQFDKWCKEMAQAGIEPVVAFDSKHISMMGELFAKPIDGTDPLYSDLAHAMRNKDRENALNILRIIRRKNPSDSNAAGQLKQAEGMMQEKRVGELLDFASNKDEMAFRKAMTAFNAEPWENEPEGNQWEQVLSYERSLKKADSLKRCKDLVSEVVSKKEKGLWMEAISLLAQIDAIVSENGFALKENFDGKGEQSYMEAVNQTRAWTAKEEANARRAKEDKAREGKLKTVVRTIQDKEIGRKRPTDELRADLAELTSVGRDLEQEGQSLSDDDLKNFNRCLIRLREEIAKRQKSLRIMIAAGCVAAVIVAGLSFFLISERMLWNEQYETLITGVDSRKNAEDLEGFINSFVKDHPERSKEVEFESEIKKSRNFIAEARRFNDQFGERIQNMAQEVDQADNLESIAGLLGRKKLLWEELNRLNPAYLDKRQEQLRKIDLDWNQKRDNLQSEISKVLIGKLSETSSFVENKLGMDQSPEVISANLTEYNKLLIDLEAEAEKYSNVEGLGLSSGQKDLLASMRKSYEDKKATLASFDEILKTIENADSVDSLFGGLDSVIRTGLTGAPQYAAAQELLLSRGLFSGVEARRFMPDDPLAWSTAIDNISTRYKAQQVLPQELASLSRLFGDDRTENIYSSPYYSSADEQFFEQKIDSWFPVNKQSVLARRWTKGRHFSLDLTFKRGIIGEGSYILEQKGRMVTPKGIEDESIKSEWVGVDRSFEVTGREVTVKGQLIVGGSLNPKQTVLSAESEYMHGEDSELLKYFSSREIKDSPLRFLDSLKGRKIDVFIKARLFMTVCELMEFRPHEWGLRNNPNGPLSVQEHYESFKQAVGAADLVQEWYKFLSTGQETSMRKELGALFDEAAEVSYFKEARFYEKFWTELLSSSFRFEGFCKLDGEWSKEIPGHAWGLSAEKKTIQVLRKNANEAIPYSPILSLDKEFADILNASRAHAGFENSKDINYVKLKKSLPYPFLFLPEDG